jgi:hypothetical protein
MTNTRRLNKNVLVQLYICYLFNNACSKLKQQELGMERIVTK